MPRLWRLLLLLACLAVLRGSAHAADDPLALEAQGRLRHAMTVAREQSAAAPTDGRMLAIYARLLSDSGRPDEALPLAEKAVKLADGDALVHEALAEVCGAKAQRAGMFEAYGLAKRVRRECERAIALDPKQIDARLVLLQFHLQAPGVAGGDKKQAARIADELVALDAARGWLAKADVARRTDTTQVLACTQKAVEVAPKSARALVSLASWYTRAPHEDLAQVRRLAEAALAAEPTSMSAWAMLAGVAAHDSRWDDLAAILAKADAALPENRYPSYAAARTLLSEHREFARAEALLRRYLAQPPELQTPSEGAARWRLAQALEGQGRKADAVAELQAAVKLEPKLEDAKRDLKRLKG